MCDKDRVCILGQCKTYEEVKEMSPEDFLRRELKADETESIFNETKLWCRCCGVDLISRRIGRRETIETETDWTDGLDANGIIELEKVMNLQDEYERRVDKKGWEG